MNWEVESWVIIGVCVVVKVLGVEFFMLCVLGVGWEVVFFVIGGEVVGVFGEVE